MVQHSPHTENEGIAHPQLVPMARQLLLLEERLRNNAYLCSEGYPTIGVGQRIGPKGADVGQYQFTLPTPVALKWLEINIALLIGELLTHPKIAPAFANCNLVRQTILVSMAYQLGVNGLAGFSHTLAALSDSRWVDAKTHALDSRWAKQTPQRALRHANTLATGELPMGQA